MKVSSDLDSKIISLQQEIKSLKTSQILGGDNSRVYKYYLQVTSPVLYKKSGYYIRKSDYDDPDFVPVPGAGYVVTGLVYPLIDDPFALVQLEKIEVWRGGKLLTWSSYNMVNGLGGQRSQYGESLIVRYTKSGNGWGSGTTPRLGTTIRLEMDSPSNLSDNPGNTIQYEYRLWIRSTSLSGYGFESDYTGGY